VDSFRAAVIEIRRSEIWAPDWRGIIRRGWGLLVEGAFLSARKGDWNAFQKLRGGRKRYGHRETLLKKIPETRDATRSGVLLTDQYLGGKKSLLG